MHTPRAARKGADALEDWSQEQVLYGLRKWRNENPSKRPNPGHILAILKDMRGRAEIKRRSAKPDDAPEPARQQATQEQRDAIMREIGVTAEQLTARGMG